MMMMKNMATTSFKSTSGSVLVALVVLLVAVMVAETEAQFVSATVVNELDAPLTMIVIGTGLATPQTTTFAPRSDGTIQVSAEATLAGLTITLEVRGCFYGTTNSPPGTVLSNTGTSKFYLTGHCGTGVPGLQFLSTIEGDVCMYLGCAAPLDPHCTGPIS